MTLKSGNLLHYREGDQQSQGGVGFLVRKALVNNIDVVRSVSSRVAYLILRISKRYSLKVIQVYAPTSTHPDDEVEAMFEEISTAIHSSQSHYTVEMRDFNAKLSRRCGDELKPERRKWTWLSPDGTVRNEIDFIMSTNKHLFNDVSVINTVKTGNNH
ncbi:uncharacterized protein LOC123661869 [Melitaea cinxia]|uniref:uncharacterized protein LOC123661869 n=1 Tax=Melitaea cinxia TaxID=113334 RepID=UPI001E274C80|nr:uncharacterized protein LOC123661869 [Melitaea cinxia]